MIQGAIGAAGPGNSLHIQRLDGGFFMVSPPEAPTGAEFPSEVLLTAAQWLDVRLPGKRDEEGRPSIAWAVDEPLAPEGAAFQVNKMLRPFYGKDSVSYMVTAHTPPAAAQCLKHVPMHVLEAINEWMGKPGPEAPTNAPMHVAAVMARPEMALDEDGIFIIAVEPAPTPTADMGAVVTYEYVLRNEDGRLRTGIPAGEVADYLRQALASNEGQKAYFAARLLENRALEVGPMLEEGSASF